MTIKAQTLLWCRYCEKYGDHDSDRCRTVPSVVFIDSNGPGCKCGPDCEMPCWQRIGLTDQKCCAGCAALPPIEEDPVPDEPVYSLFINKERTVLVRFWSNGPIEVCTREPHGVWGPPTIVEQEVARA